MRTCVIYSRSEIWDIPRSTSGFIKEHIYSIGAESILVHFAGNVACSFPVQTLNPALGETISSLSPKTIGVKSSRHILILLDSNGEVNLFRNISNGNVTTFSPWRFTSIAKQQLFSNCRVVEVAAGDAHVLFRTCDGRAFSLGQGNGCCNSCVS